MTDQPQIRFDDGAAYEQMMGVWSRLVGDLFLDWLRPDSQMRWVDVGCGNGAFSQLLFDRCDPAHLTGVDPSEGQLAYARGRLSGRTAEFIRGDAMALPFDDRSFDAAAMALVIFFVPNPAKSVAEMARVVRPGGLVATYGWDIMAGGLPMEPVSSELRSLGVNPPLPPSRDAASITSLQSLWSGAGLSHIETRQIVVQRRFADFDEFWKVNSIGPAAQTFAALTTEQTNALKSRLRERLRFEASGQVTCNAFANAIKGRVPA
jgi:ubiquinone/menaquinone biosynthesis C-methylase UbiE